MTSRAARAALTVLAITVAAFCAADVAGVPDWVNALGAALSVGFAAVGIIPPDMIVYKMGNAAPTKDDTVARRYRTRR